MRAIAHVSRKRRKNNTAAIALCLFLFTHAVALQGLDIEEARALEKSDVAEAITAYRSILDAKLPDGCKAAQRLAVLLPTMDEKRTVLLQALDICTDPVMRHTNLVSLAKIDEITGNLDKAQKLFQEASFALPDKKDFRSLLASAQLLHELGEYRGAEAQARAIADTNRIQDIAESSLVLLSRVYFATEREQKAVQIMSELINVDGDALSPSALLWCVELSRMVKDESLEELAMQTLLRVYPNSTETAIAAGDVAYLPSPSVFIGMEPVESSDTPVLQEAASEQTVNVVTGSYSVRENAVYALGDLKKAGMDALIKEVTVGDKTFYRVLLDGVTLENVDALLSELKGKGFAGFKVFDTD